jgi:hypothetical protein
MGAGAVGGALGGVGASGGNAIAMIFLVPIGFVGGTVYGAVAPATVSVEPTTQQMQASKTIFKKVLQASFTEHNDLQSALISAGNRLGRQTFVPFQQTGAGEGNIGEKAQSSARVVKGILSVSSLSVVLIGSDAKDPLLKLRVAIRLLLTNDRSPTQCLGWYATTWEGQKRHLSELTAKGGESLKTELGSAFDELSKEAVKFLFTPRLDLFRFVRTEPAAPLWANCIMGNAKNVKNPLAVLESYCPLADRGIPEYQIRVGNVLYNESNKSRKNLIRAYVWYSLATKGNDRLAVDRVEILSQILTAEELKEARQKFADWKPGQCMSDVSDALANGPE